VQQISTVETVNPWRSSFMATAAVGIWTESSMPPKKAIFPRSARLLRHADFERVYKQGRRHFSASMTVFYWARPEVEKTSRARVPEPHRPSAHEPVMPHGLRVGFTVSRALGGAVQRNRMKRRLREAVRMTRPVPGLDVDIVINPKKSLLAVDFSAVVSEVSRAFDVIEQKFSIKTPEVVAAKKFPGGRDPQPGSRS
jgi:ribonuclease P protein component